jgi:hypothetical protein
MNTLSYRSATKATKLDDSLKLGGAVEQGNKMESSTNRKKRTTNKSILLLLIAVVCMLVTYVFVSDFNDSYADDSSSVTFESDVKESEEDDAFYEYYSKSDDIFNDYYSPQSIQEE